MTLEQTTYLKQERSSKKQKELGDENINFEADNESKQTNNEKGYES